MVTFQGDPTRVRATAATTVDLAEQLRGLLGQMSAAQEDLRNVYKTPGGGAAAQRELTQHRASGDVMVRSGNKVGENLGITATKTSDQDDSSASAINAVSGSSKVDTSF